MRNAWAIAKREFAGFFLTPVGYVVVGVMALITGLAFTLSFLTYARMSQAPTEYGFTSIPDFAESLLSPFLVFCGTMIMFLSPLITMRLIAEEKHKGTIELLLTHPLRDREIIFGKYFAALGMILVMMAIVAIDLALVYYFVPVEPAVLVFGLLAVFLMGAALLSLGMFISSVTHNQITSGTITFGVSLILFIIGSVGDKLPAKNPAPATWPELMRTPVGFAYKIVRAVVMELPVDAHAKEMAQGIVQPKDIVYYLLFTAFFLFLTFRALESRNWRA